jgi:hypothetical protein
MKRKPDASGIPEFRLERLMRRVGLGRYEVAEMAGCETDKDKLARLGGIDAAFAGIAHDLTELGAGPVAKETKPVREPERQG